MSITLPGLHDVAAAGCCSGCWRARGSQPCWENDGPSMVSYTATGAAYGMGFFLPFIVATFAMAIVCQEMCMRVGAVTHRGYGQLVLERFAPVWGWFAAGDLLFTNLVTGRRGRAAHSFPVRAIGPVQVAADCHRAG
jgi:Natural resistance-associated macrophage protein